MKPLPIHQILPQLCDAVSSVTNILLHAPPGAGKTTRVPLALLEIIPPEMGRIIMLEPRRLAAVSAARWMAAIMGEQPGETVGYCIRFESRVSKRTRIEVVTEGILTRRIQNDPLLEGVAVVIFDEFHERSLHADLGLALCLDLQAQVRPDLKILVMSATLECEPLLRLMGNARLISSAGRGFPVREIFLEQHATGRLVERMAAAIRQALAECEGDVLAFLPGAGEIRSCLAYLQEAGTGERAELLPLYGELPFEEQQRAILPGERRRVVLATSIAETSLTIEGVRVVIDSGLSRRLRHDPSSGMNRLVTVRESRASAEQRAGRAGRVAEGVCYRLFSSHSFSAMTPHTPPEILESDLAPLLLELAAWGAGDPAELAWLDPPPPASMAVARQLLLSLGALDTNGRITASGRAMARLPLHPRLARLLERSREMDLPALGCALAALLAERDPVRRVPAAERRGATVHFDMHDRVELLRSCRSSRHGANELDRGALRAVERVYRHLLRLRGLAESLAPPAGDVDHVCRLLLAAYPDRVARRREGEEVRYLLANGRGARLLTPLPGGSGALLLVVAVDGGEQGEGVIHIAQEVSQELIRGELGALIVEDERVFWDDREGRVIALREERLGAVALAAAPFVPELERSAPVILERVRAAGLGLLACGEAFQQTRARIALLSRTFPEDDWPDFSDGALLATLEEWLAPVLDGVRTARQLAALDPAPLLLNRLEYRRKAALDELAPTHVTVPTGSRIRLDYCQGETPVLAVKLQELFGLDRTPAIARGKVPLLLHLLSPAGRPLQVTRDLKGFWDSSYHQVKKEMKGRYPKHPWPDDPWSAPPTRRTKPGSKQKTEKTVR